MIYAYSYTRQMLCKAIQFKFQNNACCFEAPLLKVENPQRTVMFFLSCYICEIQVRYFLKLRLQTPPPGVCLVCIIFIQRNVQQAVLPLPSTSAIAWRHQRAVHTARPCLPCRKTGRSACLVERGRKHAFDCNSASVPYGHKDTSTVMLAQIWLLLWGLLWVKNY